MEERPTAQEIDRYLRLMRWARRRYCDKDGSLTTKFGGWPTRYTLIDDIAGARILGLRRHWPALTLADALPHGCNTTLWWGLTARLNASFPRAA